VTAKIFLIALKVFWHYKDWGCVILREIDFLLKICWSIPCLHPSWKVHTWISNLGVTCGLKEAIRPRLKPRRKLVVRGCVTKHTLHRIFPTKLWVGLISWGSVIGALSVVYRKRQESTSPNVSSHKFPNGLQAMTWNSRRSGRHAVLNTNRADSTIVPKQRRHWLISFHII